MNATSEDFNAASLVVGGCSTGELFKTDEQGVLEGFEAISVYTHTGMFDVVQVFPHLLSRLFFVVEKGNEIGDCLFEVDAVLPQGIVGIDHQRLSAGPLCFLNGHRESILGELGFGLKRQSDYCLLWSQIAPEIGCRIYLPVEFVCKHFNCTTILSIAIKMALQTKEMIWECLLDFVSLRSA